MDRIRSGGVLFIVAYSSSLRIIQPKLAAPQFRLSRKMKNPDLPEEKKDFNYFLTTSILLESRTESAAIFRRLGASCMVGARIVRQRQQAIQARFCSYHPAITIPLKFVLLSYALKQLFQDPPNALEMPKFPQAAWMSLHDS